MTGGIIGVGIIFRSKDKHMKCFYHADLDGEASAAIVKLFYKCSKPMIGMECKYIPINYNHDFPFDTIQKGESIVIVDFSLQKDGEFEKLLEITNNVIWIDHHKTAIEKHGDLDIKGIRRIGMSGCELTWDYFCSDKPVPEVIKLIGDYDTWAFRYGDTTKKMHAALGLYDTSPEGDIWEAWFNWSLILKESILKDGRAVLEYRKFADIATIKALSFYTTLDSYRVIACNRGLTSSSLFDSIPDNSYDIMAPFSFDGKQRTVSLYTKRDDIDVSEIAKKCGKEYGTSGGGHKKAAGYQTYELPFKNKEESNNGPKDNTAAANNNK